MARLEQAEDDIAKGARGQSQDDLFLQQLLILAAEVIGHPGNASSSFFKGQDLPLRLSFSLFIHPIRASKSRRRALSTLAPQLPLSRLRRHNPLSPLPHGAGGRLPRERTVGRRWRSRLGRRLCPSRGPRRSGLSVSNTTPPPGISIHFAAPFFCCLISKLFHCVSLLTVPPPPCLAAWRCGCGRSRTCERCASSCVASKLQNYKRTTTPLRSLRARV